MADITEADIQDLTRQLVVDVPPDDVDQFEFRGAQFDRGLALVQFPVGLGGLGLSSRRMQTVVDAELRAAGVTYHDLNINPIGIGMGAPVVLTYATEEQKKRLLRPMYTGEEVWCQMFSEPDAGSDLANAGMRADRDGDEWVLNGSKVWTSRGAYARWGMCLARTDASLAKHRGLTMFAVEMSAPGVEVRPLVQINGDRHFTEVFVSDVRVPDADRIGDLGAGWGLTVETLAHERATIGGRAFGGGDAEEVGLPSWLEEWRNAGRLDGPVERQAAMRSFVEHRVNQMATARAAALADGSAPGPEGSMAKLRSVAAFKSRAYLGKNLRGAAGMLSDSPGHLEFLTAPSMSIRGGTDEVQRNIIGERVLGLSREPDPYKGAAWDTVPRN